MNRVTGFPGHNRKKPKAKPWCPGNCHACGRQSVSRYHYGGTRLCRECGDMLDAGVLTWDMVRELRAKAENTEAN